MSSQLSGCSEPLRPSSAFELLHPKIQRWIWEHNWSQLHEVQETAARPLLDGKSDVIIAARTAGGKTEAAFFPILTSLARTPTAGIQALYVSPLKALIDDQFGRLSELAPRLGIPVHRWHGDVGDAERRRLLAKPAGVLLITPESLEAFFVLRGSVLPTLMHGLAYVIVDELHAFIGTERGRQLQSLLSRVEQATGRRIPRVALSATLGDMSLAAEHLRPGEATSVVVVASHDDRRELQLLLCGFRRSGHLPTNALVSGNDSWMTQVLASDEAAIARHLFSAIRGSKNLVFANSRRNVELYTDALRRLCEEAQVPQEFSAHHGNLSAGLRRDAEADLRDSERPATLVCTTTLELGIDIGSVKSVAQIGAPPSVASLRQRLGRSGRRDEPAVLRFYVGEVDLKDALHPEDELRVELVESLAMLRLLLAGWCEPPSGNMLHLSTLLQQVLSLIAERGGVTAPEAWAILCARGPFRNVDQQTFARLLKEMGQKALLAQAPDGTILPGRVGELIINSRDFYAVFFSPAEYRLVSEGSTLGTLPIARPLQPGVHIIFAGRRWRVVSVDEARRVIELLPSSAGRVPKFAGAFGLVHERVREEMLLVYQEQDEPAFLSPQAKELLREGRASYYRLGLERSCLVSTGHDTLLFCWTGDRVLNTLQAQLVERALQVTRSGLALWVSDADPDELADRLRAIGEGTAANGPVLAQAIENKVHNKYDAFLPKDLLEADYAARAFDPAATRSFVRRLVDQGFRPSPPNAA